MDDDCRTIFLNKNASFNKSGSLVGRKSRKLNTGRSVDLNLPQQFNKPRPTSTLLSPKSVNDDGIDTVTEANDLLENGILVETDNGYYQCLSLKDALTSGIGGLNLSVEDLQNVAAQLLIAQKGPSPTEVYVEDVTDSTSAESTAVNRFMYCNDEGVLKQNVETTPNSVEVQIEVSHVFGTKGTKNIVLPKEEKTVAEQFMKNETDELNPTNTAVTSVHPKKRGGWPKGRKRKPDLTDIQPPKAPATGYVLFLNEKRKEYKDLPFPEVTKLLGNEWSNLSLEEKKIYLDRADVEKKRYREELKAYRQSDAYQSYLNRKRIKKLQGNGTEESDMDATDEIEDEDNEELYCRTCDQWFSSLHNKKEHLYGRQHLQVIAGDFTREHLAEQDNGVLSSSQSVSTSLDESSLDGLPIGMSKGTTRNRHDSSPAPANMAEAILHLMQTNAVRDREIKVLGCQLNEAKSKNARLNNQLNELKGRQSKLMQDLENEKVIKQIMEENICALWTVPSHYYIGPPQVENLPAPNFIFNRIS